jgi:hypothetical protein
MARYVPDHVTQDDNSVCEWEHCWAAAGAWLAVSQSSAEEGRAIPAPAVDEAAMQGTTPEVAVLAGGCFWGVQGVYQHVKGVSNAVSGYAGGESSTAQYEVVGSGTTGHAESVSITFDPSVISYGRILQIYFSVAHDPTQLNRGPGYRHAIPLDDLSTSPSRRGSPRLYRSAQPGAGVRCRHRHHDRTDRQFYPPRIIIRIS